MALGGSPFVGACASAVVGVDATDATEIDSTDAPSDAVDTTPGLRRVRVIDMAGDSACAVHDSGAVSCWGFELGGLRIFVRPRPVPLPRPAVDVHVSPNAACAVLDDGTVWCWGANDQGQLGSIERGIEPGPVSLPSAAVSVALARWFSCAVLDVTGEVWCWGRALGLDAPAMVGRIGVPVSTATGKWSHVCFLHEAGASCLGALQGEDFGPNTNDDFHTPVTINLTALQSISAGLGQTCGVHTDGRVECRGTPVPTPAGLPPDARSVSIGESHACVVDGSSSVWCWGQNSDGQVGGGPPIDTMSSVVRVDGLTGVLQVATSWRSTCVIVGAEREVRCWGFNGGGALGDGTLISRSTPRAVLGE